jgi:multidrug efflux pump subunit AcrA (membrane-fusion protein)
MNTQTALALALAAAMLVTSGCGSPTEEPLLAAADQQVAKIPVKVAPVVESDLSTTLELVGSLIPQRRSIIVSAVDGVVQKVSMAEKHAVELMTGGRTFRAAPRLDIGVEVIKDEILLELDPEEYELKLQAAKARLESAKKQAEHLYAWRRPEEVRRIEAEREEAAARVALAEANLQRSRDLIDRNAIAQANLDQHETDLRTAEASLARVEAELELAKAGPTQEEIAVVVAAIAQAQADVDQAKWELDNTIIRAPFDGVVTERFVDEGERVTAMPRVEIMELVDLSVVNAQLCVPEQYMNRIHAGDMAKVFVKNCPEPVSGVVSLVNDKVDPENRTFRIRISIPNEDQRLKAGQFVRVAIDIESSANTLVVPSAAVTYSGGEAHVFVQQDQHVAIRPVQLGLMNGKTAEVLSGLSVGEHVVVDDPAVLSDGMQVEVVTSDS